MAEQKRSSSMDSSRTSRRPPPPGARVAPPRRFVATADLDRRRVGGALDPVLTRRRSSSKGLYFWCLGAAAFGAYAFDLGGMQTWADGFFQGLNDTAQAENDVITAASSR